MGYSTISITFLGMGRPCELSCPGCWYGAERDTLGLTLEEQKRLALKVMANYPDAPVLMYPPEITNTPELVPFLRRIGQRSVVTNGIRLEPLVGTLKAAGVTTLKVTLFARRRDQAYFNETPAGYYEKIKAGIGKAVAHGMRVVAYNVLDRVTAQSLLALCETCVSLGIRQVIFHRRVPRSSGEGTLVKHLLREADMPAVLQELERLRRRFAGRLRLSMGLNFGPNLFGRTPSRKPQRQPGGEGPNEGGPRSRLSGQRLCPTMGGGHRAISLRSGNIYWCCTMVSRPDLAKIGWLDPRTGRMEIDAPSGLSFETLSRRLRGRCSSAGCRYHADCLGGCRATAMAMASLRGEPEPLYAELDVCLTRVYARLAAEKAVTPDEGARANGQSALRRDRHLKTGGMSVGR